MQDTRVSLVGEGGGGGDGLETESERVGGCHALGGGGGTGRSGRETVVFPAIQYLGMCQNFVGDAGALTVTTGPLLFLDFFNFVHHTCGMCGVLNAQPHVRSRTASLSLSFRIVVFFSLSYTFRRR